MFGVSDMLAIRLIARFHPSRLLHTLVLATALLAPQLSASATAQDQSYKIASGDILQVTVYGDPGLSGEFSVGVDGAIGYPLLGSVPVADRSLLDIGKELGSALAQHIPGLSVSVSVKQYAPVFIIGDVQKPGKYDYRPGMIALELFALSGGLTTPNDRNDTAGAQLVAARAEYADTALDVFSNQVRRARLEAELADKPFEFVLPVETDPQDVADRQKIIDTERRYFDLRIEVLKRAEASLQTQRRNYLLEVKTLEESAKLRGGELDLLQQSLDAATKLVERGLTSQANLREAQRQLSSMRRDVLEFGSFLARAKQNENAIQQQLDALVDQRRNDAAKELRDIVANMPRQQKKLAYLLQRMAEISAAAQRAETRDQAVKVVFSVVRAGNGGYTDTVLAEHDPIRTGDILKVDLAPLNELAARNVN